MADSFDNAGSSTVSFCRIPKKDREDLLGKIIEFTEGDVNKVDAKIIKTAVKSMVSQPDCSIAGKPLVVSEKYGDTLHIPVKNCPLPAIVSVKYIQDIIARKL